MKVGELFTMDVTCHRKWWQIWKPRTWTERRSFNVTGLAASQEQYGGIVFSSDGEKD